jgi:mono/diheme cytochrome c family protein
MSCSHTSIGVMLTVPKPTVYGAAIVESSGGKQTAQAGTALPQPVVVQVNDEQGMAGRYQITASTTNKSRKKVALNIEEVALGYQQTLGRQLNDQYCERCHNAESTVERVSNFDNLEIKPHPFTEGDALNKISDADLTAIISHGGPALGKSALMPAWGNNLSKSDILALISYIRAVSDPPSRNAGPVYAQK